MIQALIFDFDGTILETETPDYQAWQELYAHYDCELPLDVWSTAIGAHNVFDPCAYLEQQSGRAINRTAVQQQVKQRAFELACLEEPLPGVLAYIEEAQQLGLRLGVASSSTHSWVDVHLERLRLTNKFETIRCRDDVGNRAKPDPAVYLAAIGALGTAPQQAVAIEDSYNGLTGAKRAGLYGVAVPNALTRHMDFSQADYRLHSLTDMSLTELIESLHQQKNDAS